MFPPIALRLLQLISDEEVALSALLKLLRADPAFAAELLRRANSPQFGLAARINTVQHALVVLGFRRIRALTLTVAARMYLGNAVKAVQLRRSWQHTLACAVLAEELARACGVDEDPAYTAGLLHGVGRLGLMVAYPARYAAFLETAEARLAEDPACDVLACEREILGVDHCAAGEFLCREWNLPPEFAAVMGRHHVPSAPEETSVPALVHIACALADALGFAAVRHPSPPALDQLRGRLPASARQALPEDAAELRLRVERRLAALEVNGDPVEPKATSALWTPEPPEAPAPALSNGARREAAVFTRDILIAVLVSLSATALFLWIAKLLSWR